MAYELIIYEHCNSATETLLHMISLIRSEGRVKGFGKLIPKKEGDNSRYYHAEYLNFNFEEKYFDENYKIYKGGSTYKSAWVSPICDYSKVEEGVNKTWGGP